MGRNLAVFFDGTWNEPNDRTNAYTLYRSALETDGQETFYVEGVGTKGRGLWAAIDKFAGGAFGAGLSANIRDGYRWLSQRYAAGDRLFLFGFSRGAYSARSLAGMIRKCGLLREPTDDGVGEAYALYRDECAPKSPEASAFRDRFSHAVDIDFVGVWDTVGRLGVPVGGIRFPGFSGFYQFHDTELSNHVLRAYHAIAANEYRAPYAPTLWTRADASVQRPADRPVEQRWFIGAHADIGGGYADGCLHTLPARWLQQRAQDAGMLFDPQLAIGEDYDACEPHPSYEEFTRKVPIPIDKEPRSWTPGVALNLTIDRRLRQRLLANPACLGEYTALRENLLSLPAGPD
ncbi:DUF2235 domain-containing protein [Cupriavidus respiraculi]|uniref:T6SS Phospholipase effector Tle1-like catalytic domain-containing protein n=1 Tax=Cupriavidus respiraculi TaxID=195930 RepID=A0ABM8WVB1_9BURK|nr:DUF2235 domain-containing protein [Cupriavidus respiraculi]CAG9171462.1 hypothetical protein LMG21510_01673 [Cupriavidus respiraculi]